MSVYQGKKLKIEISGASHDSRISGCLEGLPAGEAVDLLQLRSFTERRMTGRYAGSTARKEPDEAVITSGLTGGRTDGTALNLYIENRDVRKRDYASMLGIPRPGHADLGAWLKYGPDYDMSGGGPFSGRLTAVLCALGGIAEQLLEHRGIFTAAHILSVADIKDEPIGKLTGEAVHGAIRKNSLPVLSEAAAERMLERIAEAAAEGDSVGGTVECAVFGMPGGIGGELFDGIEGALAPWLFAIPAVKGLAFGSGFDGSRLRGSENNDPIILKAGRIETETNNCGGILGGISTGMPLNFTVAVKPTSSIAKPQRTVDITSMTERELVIRGRHDACIVPRAVPVIEAVTALAVLDMLEDADGQ